MNRDGTYKVLDITQIFFTSSLRLGLFVCLSVYQQYYVTTELGHA